MDEVLRFLVESNLTTIIFLGGMVFVFIAVVGKIKTLIEPSPPARMFLGLMGLFLMAVSFWGWVQYSRPPSWSSTPATPSLLAETPVHSTMATPQDSTSSTPVLVKGQLIYEDDFDDSSDWNIEEGVAIENGNMIIWPGYDAVPTFPADYTDFIFESRFYIPESGGMAFYLRHQRPPCAGWNCSIQIALYFGSGSQEVVARRWVGDAAGQQFDIRKVKSTSLYSPGWNKVDVQVQGDTYRVYVNDMFIFDFVDDTYLSGAFVIDNAPVSSGEIKIDYVRIFQVP